MKKSFIKYIAALLLFGSNGIVARHIGLESTQIVLLRTLIGSLMLLLIFLICKNKFTFPRFKRDLLFISISGVAMGPSWMFLYEAYARIGVGVASLLYYCGPVIVMILSPILFKERLTATKIVGFLAVLCGIFLINGNSSSKMDIFGVICGLASAVAYSVMVMANKKSANIRGMENSLIQLCVSFLTVAIFSMFRGSLIFQVAAADWGWILMLGLVNTGIGCWFYFSSISDLPVQTVAVCGYLEPLSAVIFSLILLGERLTALQFVGALLIIGGAVVAELADKLFESLKKKSA